MKDKIEIVGHAWDITIDGETLGTRGWEAHPKCQVKDSTIRKRCRMHVKDPTAHPIKWIVFGAPTRIYAPPKHITKHAKKVETESWEAERNRVARSLEWSPVLQCKRLWHEMGVVVCVDYLYTRGT